MRSAFVQTRDLRVHYLFEGNGTRQPLLLLHGFPETSYSWRRQMPALGEHFAVFAPDNRGFGKTDKPDIRVSRSLLAADVVNFLDAVGIGRAIIVGHDWGGIIASKFALDYPERTVKLVLMDTLCTVWAPRAVHGYWFKAKPLPEEFFAAHHRGFIQTIFTGEATEAMPGRPRSPWGAGRAPSKPWATAEDVAHYAEAFADPDAHRAAISYYRYALPFHRVLADSTAPGGERYEALDEQQVAAMWLHPDGLEKHALHADYMDYGPEDRRKRYRGPTLWMPGNYLGAAATTADDFNRPPKGNPFVDQFSRYFPDLSVHRMAAGHFFPEEVPEVTNDILLRFLLR